MLFMMVDVDIGRNGARVKNEKYVTYLALYKLHCIKLFYFTWWYEIFNFVSSCILRDTVGIRFLRVIADDALSSPYSILSVRLAYYTERFRQLNRRG